MTLDQYLESLAELTGEYERSHDNAPCLVLFCPIGTDFLDEENPQQVLEWNGEEMKPVGIVFGTSENGDTITKVYS